MANSLVWNKYDYVQKLRARIATPTCWKDICNVKISDSRSIISSYYTKATEAAGASLTRGTAYTYEDITTAADTLTISSSWKVAMLVDEADRHQQNYMNQMAIAEYQGKKLDEKIEGLVLTAAISGTNFGVTDLDNTADDDSTAITVSAANIDDIIRAVKRKIYAHNGVDFAVEKGIFFVWRPGDFELLEAFVQANGFTEADIALKNGIPVQKAFRYMGCDHYLTNSNTTGHVTAGIKGMLEIGLLRGTYGSVKFIEDPGLVSGLGIVSRIDYGTDIPDDYAEFVVDVNVA
jgi:hypothetical protein